MSASNQIIPSYFRTSNPSAHYTLRWEIENCCNIAPGTVISCPSFLPLDEIHFWYATFKISKYKSIIFQLYERSEITNLNLDCLVYVYNIDNNLKFSLYLSSDEGKYAYTNSNNLFCSDFPQGVLVIICEMTFNGHQLSTQSVPWQPISSQSVVSLSQSVVPDRCDTLKKELKGMLYNSRHYDIAFDVNGCEINAHKNILSARSKVFQKMFSIDMKECVTNAIVIEDIKPAIFKIFLEFVYTSTLGCIDFDTAKALYYVADKYGVLELRNACKDVLLSSLLKDNVFDLLVLADTHNDEEFLTTLLDFVKTHVWNDSVSNVWEQVCKYPQALAIIKKHFPEKRKITLYPLSIEDANADEPKIKFLKKSLS